MEYVKEINRINTEIKKLEEEKECIQCKCTHETKKIKFIDNLKSYMNICSDCDLVLGHPSKENLMIYLGDTDKSK